MPKTAKELKQLRKTPRVEPERWEINLLGTHEVDGPTVNFDDRITRCYELAGYAVAFGNAPAGSVLVHGSWFGPGAKQRIGHAWVELRDEVSGEWLVWEPIRAKLYDRDEWYHYVQAWPERTYPLLAVRRLIGEHNHYGRWHESRYP